MKQLLLLVLFSLLVSSSICAQEILFFDDFENGMDDAWEMPDGGWEVVDGHLEMVQGGEPRLIAGSHEQGNYIVSFDHHYGGGYAYYASVDLFLSDQPNSDFHSGYTFVFITNFAGDFIRIVRNDFENSFTLCEVNLDFQTGFVTHLKMGRLGSELVAKIWADGEIEPDWQVSFIDETYSNGYWSLIGDAVGGWFDNFQVEGYGTVSTEQTSWDGVKALYR